MSDHDKIYSTKLQDKTERSTLLMFVLTAIAVRTNNNKVLRSALSSNFVE